MMVTMAIMPMLLFHVQGEGNSEGAQAWLMTIRDGPGYDGRSWGVHVHVGGSWWLGRLITAWFDDS